MVINIKVQQKHIDASKPRTINECAVSLAILEQFGDKHFNATLENLTVFSKKISFGGINYYPASEDADRFQNFILAMDRGEPIYPTSFKFLDSRDG